ncbi:unnamed protein product [Dibothriocephalus latus]|uniref:Uncharacterized protein n=1 Tax=Dibothriocephalus latus TaxID=60516 RepID=A0A3P7L927_DIBLA|nr:unnamed protein product [Dibothriocephalus latus]
MNSEAFLLSTEQKLLVINSSPSNLTFAISLGVSEQCPMESFGDLVASVFDVETFSDEYVSLPVLQSLLNSNVVTDHVFNSRDENENIIYRANQWANYAILILQGRALVETSTEHLVFEAGPFMLFGETVLKGELSPNLLQEITAVCLCVGRGSADCGKAQGCG